MDYTSSSPPPPSDRYSYNPSLRWDPQVEEYFVNAYGAHQFARISQALARPSRYSCIRVNPLRTTSDAVIEKLLAILNETRLSTDAACMSINGSNTSQVGFGEEKHLDSSSDMHSKQDALLTGIEETSIEKLQTPPIYKCRLPGMNNVVFVKGTGPYMLEYEDGTSRPLKEVIVSRKCAESVLRGAQVFVPGVLACSAHVEKGDEVAISVAVEQLESDNEWAVGITRGTVLHGSQTDPHYDERKGLYIGKGTAMMSRAGIFRASEGIAVNLTERVYNLLSFHDVLEGEIFLQNLPSIVAAHVLDPQEGERILDMCAAPGGKTTAIAILMRDKGELIAIDRSHNKVMNILNLGAEMGLTCISAFRLDALKAVRNKSDTVDIGVTDTNKESSFNEDKESKTAEYLSNDMDSSVENCALTLTSDKCGEPSCNLRFGIVFHILRDNYVTKGSI